MDTKYLVVNLFNPTAPLAYADYSDAQIALVALRGMYPYTPMVIVTPTGTVTLD